MDDEDFINEGDVVEEIDLKAIVEGDEEDDDAGIAVADDASGDEMAEETMEERAADEPKPQKKGEDNSEFVYTGHTNSVYCVAARKDGSLIASGDGDDAIHLWHSEATSKDAVAVLKGHTDTVISLAFNSTGDLLASGSLDGTVRVWDVDTADLVAVCEGASADIEFVSFHSGGNVIIAGSADTTLWMWHINKAKKTAECMMVFAGHTEAVSCGSFSGNGKAVVSGSADGSVRVWNPRTGATTHTFTGHGWHEDAINALECAPDKPLVLTGSQDGTARLANFSTGKVVGVFRHGRIAGSAPELVDVSVVRPGEEEGDDGHASIETVSFCPTHPWVASGATDGSLIVWDTVSCNQRHKFQLDDAIIRCRWVPDRPFLVAITADGAADVWDARDGKHLAFFTGHVGMILDVDIVVVRNAVGAEVAKIYTAGDDSCCRVYSFELPSV